MNWIDGIGYVASGLIVVSFLLNELTLVRIVNICGCLCFLIYGLLKGPLWPVVLPNVILIGVHLRAFWQLKKLSSTSKA